VVLAIACIAAILGAAGFAAVSVRRQTRRIAELIEELATTDAGRSTSTARVDDPRLRLGLERLAGRLAETWTLATTDLLTGVLNRQALLMHLEDELGRAARYSRELSIVLVDLDRFKRTNDSYGHAAGDRVLNDVAQILRTHVRSVDIVGRYGGEEFMVVLPETDVDAAASIAEKLRRLVSAHESDVGEGNRVALTMSAGVAGGLGQHMRLDAIIRDADAALYSAKSLGRDQVYVFHESGDDGLVRRAAIAPQARERAIEVGRAAMGAATASLTDALDARSPWAGRPSAMIASAAVTVARSMGLSDRDVERIRVASLLHDLGKLAIPDTILSKQGELDQPEWRVVAEHPKIGQVVLEQAGALRDAATIVLHHHEWFDGRGYPHGLSGDEIPIGARIVSISDAYEAMVAGRPYRPAISHDAAIAELRRQAGQQFDPDLVELFSTLFDDGVPWPRQPHYHDHPDEPPKGHNHPPMDADRPAPAKPRFSSVGARRAQRAPADDTRSHGQIHGDVHARRRRVMRVDPNAGRPTGTEG
jgi:diguanylate cyclase (GGDEF)-like protein